MVFQIVDDVLDLTATDVQLGKPAGHDMEEGVYTLPVLHTLAAGGAAADELRSILGKPLPLQLRLMLLVLLWLMQNARAMHCHKASPPMQ
jgi:geranylgeranyl pyrophosphate synthase